MLVVSPPGAEFVQPWRTGGLPTQRLLDRRIDKNAFHSLKPCRDPQQLRLLRGPLLAIQRAAIGHDHGKSADGLARRGRQGMTVGQEPEPDVDIETGLVTGMSARRWTASRLAQVTNREGAQVLLSRGLRQVLEIMNERGMAKKASPRAPHCLKARPLRR
jgi:hypothetical protein